MTALGGNTDPVPLASQAQRSSYGGIGRRLLEELISCAEERRFERVVLETASVLKEAISLYRKRGFLPVAHRGAALRQCDQAYALELGG